MNCQRNTLSEYILWLGICYPILSPSWTFFVTANSLTLLYHQLFTFITHWLHSVFWLHEHTKGSFLDYIFVCRYIISFVESCILSLFIQNLVESGVGITLHHLNLAWSLQDVAILQYKVLCWPKIGSATSFQGTKHYIILWCPCISSRTNAEILEWPTWMAGQWRWLHVHCKSRRECENKEHYWENRLWECSWNHGCMQVNPMWLHCSIVLWTWKICAFICIDGIHSLMPLLGLDID